MHTTILVFPPRRCRRSFAARRRPVNPWLIAAIATCCAISPRFVGLSRMDIGVAHAAGSLSSQGHPVAAVVSGLVGGAGAGTAATGAIGAASGAVSARAIGAVGAATGAVGAATSATGAAASGAVGATTGAVGAAAKGALDATTSTVGAVTDTVGTAATSTSGSATSTISTATTTTGTAATDSAVDRALTLDDADALAALQASGFVTPNDDPIWLTASWLDSTGEPCRKYVQRVMINNAAIQATAVVCKRPWGTWHVTPVIGTQAVPQQAAEQ